MRRSSVNGNCAGEDREVGRTLLLRSMMSGAEAMQGIRNGGEGM